MTREPVADAAAGSRAFAGTWRRVDALAFWTMRQLVLLVLRLLFGYRVLGRVPRSGPCLVVANHTSFLDAILLGAVTPRRMRFVMTDAFAQLRGLRWFFRWNRVIFVRERARSSRQLFDQVLRALREGAAVAIFPEGGISHTGELQPLREGVLVLARRAGVPIVPVGIAGAFAALPRHRRVPRPHTIRCRVGAPLTFAELVPVGTRGRDADALAAQRLHAMLVALRDGEPREKAG